MAKKNTIKMNTKKEGEGMVAKASKKESKAVVKEVKVESTKTVVEQGEKNTDTKVEAVAKTPVKKAVKAVVKEVEKPVEKVASTKAKKESKPASKKATKVVEAKKTEAKVVRQEVEKTPVKKATSTKAKKESVKKETTPKASVKKTTASKSEKKTTTKKVIAPKAVKKQDLSKYNEVALDACLDAMRTMGVGYSYEDFCRLLLDEADMKLLEKNIIEGNDLANKTYDFKKDGYDLDVVMATLQKVEATMDISASQFKTIKKAMDQCVKTKLVVDADENAKNYLQELRVAEKVLMVGQRKNITSCVEATALLNSDVRKFFEHFKAMAYAVLRNWKYEDVEFYQEFAFAFVSQYADLFADFQNEIQMDCADLYILHGDEGRGDHEYNYVLRENEIKDYIYYRFANVYVERNLEKAKAIANSAFNWVDDRFDYFKKIVEIVEK